MSGRLSKYSDYKDSGVDWIGRIPSEWGCRQLKYTAVLSIQKATPEAADTYVGMENISSGDGKYIATSDMSPEGQSLKFQRGDVLFGKLRPYLAKSWLATFSGICSSEFLVLRTARLEPRYLNYMLLSRDFIAVVDSSTYGTKMPRASWDFIGMLKIPVPERALSEKIAKFLDYETAKIDALIAKQQQLIALLQEKRQAVISHAVTKGLNPAAPLRDSGVAWLGKVPAHWEVARLKQITHDATSGPYGSSLTKAMYTESGIRVYGQQQAIAGDFNLGDYYISQKKFTEMTRYEVFPGDVLITVMGTIGRVAVVPDQVERGIINPRLVRYKTNRDQISPEFLRMSILGDLSQARLKLMAQGSTMEGLNMQILGDLPIAIPPLQEQDRILKFLKDRCDNLDTLIKKSDQAVELLQERRTALIAAAVTGKIDVRGWQPPVANPEGATP